MSSSSQLNVLDDARKYGERLAQLLQHSGIPEDTQGAIAVLVPRMSIEQLQLLEKVLLEHLNRQQQSVLEDVILEIKAQMMRKDLANAGTIHAAHASLDALEDELNALERAGGKRN